MHVALEACQANFSFLKVLLKGRETSTREIKLLLKLGRLLFNQFVRSFSRYDQLLKLGNRALAAEQRSCRIRLSATAAKNAFSVISCAIEADQCPACEKNSVFQKLWKRIEALHDTDILKKRFSDLRTVCTKFLVCTRELRELSDDFKA